MTCYSKSSQSKLYQVLFRSLIVVLGKLYFYSNRFEPELDDAEAYSVLNIDQSIVYHGYNKDFGPLNLTGLHRYITQLQSRLDQENKIVVHHTSTNYQKQANSCFLMCAYQVIVRGITPEQAF
jgi:cell division cycle 14